MSRPQSQRALARRATSQERRWPGAVRLRTGVLHASLATLAVSVLGLGVAVSSGSESSAQDTDVATAAPSVVIAVAPGVKQPAAFHRDANTISRSSFREALSTNQTDELDVGTLTEAADLAARPAQVGQRAVRTRAAELAKESAAASRRADELEQKREEKRAKAKKKAEAAKKALGTPTLPVKSYRIAARFGDVGAWARYHTGFDFSAPTGTPIYAPAAGVVRTAGSGSAGGWAGTYVVVEHADGTQSLYAHMSSVSVRVGERVAGGTRLGSVGQTGRSFGTHLHFEIYPAGAEPGDVFSAVDPQSWLTKLGLKP